MRNSQRAIVGLLGVAVGLIVVVAISVWATGERPPELSGERTTRTYDFADFDGVSVSGQWQVTIERGDAWRVSVDVPAEVADQVRVERSGDTLNLAYAFRFGGFGGGFSRGGFGGVDRQRPFRATITMPALETLGLVGASQVSFSGFEGSALSLHVSGAVDLRGAASRFDALTLYLSGAGRVNLADVPVTDANVAINGAASVTLRMAGGRLSGDMSGTANLEYSGTVSEETIDRSGFVNIRRRN
jgi:putative autotransporter adhesin-like protein